MTRHAEYSAAIDLYENTWISLQEYEAPVSIRKRTRTASGELIDATERATASTGEDLHQAKSIQSGKKQYIRFADTSKYYIVNENGAKSCQLHRLPGYRTVFDHRPIGRESPMANGKRSATCSATPAALRCRRQRRSAFHRQVDSSSTYRIGPPANIG
jgi:hypothetical protein